MFTHVTQPKARRYSGLMAPRSAFPAGRSGWTGSLLGSLLDTALHSLDPAQALRLRIHPRGLDIGPEMI
jgi:hypothetical protein